MKMSKNFLYIALFFVMFFVHFGIWQYLGLGSETILIRYYLFLTIMFMMVLTVISIAKKIYPDYIGFVFMGLVMLKLSMAFIIRKKLNITEVPGYKVHFIIPYLVSLLLETLFTVNVIKSTPPNSAPKDEKNQ